MNNTATILVSVLTIAAVTTTLRALPFLLFSGKSLPWWLSYLGKVLPPAIMTTLVIYLLRNSNFTSYPFGLPEIISSLLVVLLQWTRRNMYLSIIVGTLCYMLLIRIM